MKKSSAQITATKPKMYLEGLHSSKAYLTYKTADEVLAMYKKRKLVIPPFQRKRGIWKKNQNQDLIMTMIRGLPVMPFLVQEQDGIFFQLDGNQRLWNEINFKNNNIKISKTYDPMLGGMRWKDLEPETQKRYNAYPIPFLVVVGGNGVGVQTYIRANSGIPLNKAEKRRAMFYNSAFSKLVIKVTKQMISFYRNNQIITENDILRSKEEEVIAENIILTTREATDGSDLDSIYDQWRTQKKLNQHILVNPITILQGHFATINAMFGTLVGTGFDNPNNFYGLLGAVKKAKENNLIPNNAKMEKVIGDRLVNFLKEVSNYSKAGIAGNTNVANYHKTITRGTRDLKNRENRISILLDEIVSTTYQKN